MPRALPPHPDLEQYKKQAKDLLKAARAGEPEAQRQIAAARNRRGHYFLADAQLALAREHGFQSWSQFANEIEAQSGGSARSTIWRAAANAVIAGDDHALDELLEKHSGLLRQHDPPAYVPSGPGPHYGDRDARTIIAREHHFENWQEFEAHRWARADATSQTARFEKATDAIVTGDVGTLARLLQEDPSLIHVRSQRKHHSQLLHYLGANGIEGFRQKTPKNSVAVLELLLDAGARVNAVADMYRGTTTLGLVATSIHPELAGVQDELIAVLLEHGATFDGAVASDYTSGSVVNACLANGRPHAAQLLAERGARLDLEGAAGVGRLDIVKSFFSKDGKLQNAMKEQLLDGFAWACEYGRSPVVEFLLERGFPLAARLKHDGQTGLHWAAVGGHEDIVRLLLEHGAPVQVVDETHGGTPLEWCVYGWSGARAENARARYYRTIDLLIAAGARVRPEWLNDPDRENMIRAVRSDPRMVAALGGPAVVGQ